MSWQSVIGLEVHVQLATQSKLFSSSATAFGAEPNTQANEVDLGFPGTLPVPNRAVLDMAIAFALAIDANIAERSIFARKNYFYPDLPKGYQISQYETPIVAHGKLRVRMDEGRELEVEIVRAHIEEDAGKSVHDAFHGQSALDLNRAGTPLLEIVTAPVLRSSLEAVAFLKTLHTLVRALGISDGNMQEGSFRCDANVSVHRAGTPLGTRAEIKNVNSFRFVEKAIDYEIERQIRLLEAGESVRQETRLYDAARHETRSMRSKENADDYRYFPDPDLPPIAVSKADIARVRAALPELPEHKRNRYQTELALSAADAQLLSMDKDASDYFDAALKELPTAPRLLSTWMLGELKAALNAEGLEYHESKVRPPELARLLKHVASDALSQKQAKQAFEAMWQGRYESAEAAIEGLGLKQISNRSALEAIIAEVLGKFPEQVTGFKNGNEKLLMFLIGQAMKLSRGQANPKQLEALMRERISASG
jgi:aspartyl-tRNA(Asn)/glutamyl-tRNA(Gln) amidotransferase subunit B